MKVLVILTIIFSSLLFPISAFAQTTTGTCRNGTNGFVDWQKCLAGSTDGGGGGTITQPVFINNAYEKYYKETLSNCNAVINNPIFIDFVGQMNENKCVAFSSTMVLNKFALDIFTILLGIMFLIFSFLIFRSRIMYITAGDNEDQVKKSKKIATAAFVGFLFIFFGLIFGQILAGSIGSSLFDIKLFG